MTSWLKATQRRVKETILQSVGAHDKTLDQEFDDRCAKFISFYRDLTKVHMSMQLWLDSVDLLCGSWVGMGESLTKFCTSNDSDSSLYDLAKGFSSIGNDVNIILKGIMKSIFIDRCLKPIESILAIVPIINQKIQERKNILLDVAFYNSKKQSEKSSGKDDNHPNVIKIINKLNESERLLKNLTDDIESCIDQLCSARPFMLGPEIASLIACMETFPLIISQKVGQMTSLIPQTASTKCLLLASIETAEINLKSNGIVESLKSNSSSFPIEPVLRRTGAMGGTTGGYGHAGFLEGLMSTVDLLLRSSDPSLRNSGNLDLDSTRESMSISRDSQSIRISSSSTNSNSGSGLNSTSLNYDLAQIRSSSPSPNTLNNPPSRALTAGKRQVIKLGSDRPVSTKLTNPIDVSNNSNNSNNYNNNNLSNSSNEPSHVTRPLSTLKPSYPPPKPPKDDSSVSSSSSSTSILNGDNNNNNNNSNGNSIASKRIPSKRLTGSALLMSGRPRDLLGASSSSSVSSTSGLNQSDSLEDVSEEGIEYDRWQESNCKFYLFFNSFSFSFLR